MESWRGPYRSTRPTRQGSAPSRLRDRVASGACGLVVTLGPFAITVAPTLGAAPRSSAARTAVGRRCRRPGCVLGGARELAPRKRRPDVRARGEHERPRRGTVPPAPRAAAGPSVSQTTRAERQLHFPIVFVIDVRHTRPIRDSGAGVLAGGVARHAPYPRPSVRAPAGPEAWTGDERDRRPRDRPPSTHRSATRVCVSHRAPCEARVSSRSLS